MIHDHPVLLDKDHKECDKSTHYYNHETNECQPCDSGRIKMSAQDIGGHDSSACAIPRDEVSHAPTMPVVEGMSVAQTFDRHIQCDSNLTCKAPDVCDRKSNTCLSIENYLHMYNGDLTEYKKALRLQKDVLNNTAIPQDEVSHAPAMPVVEDMSVARVRIECGPGYTCEAPLVCDRKTTTCLSPEDNFKQNTLLPIPDSSSFDRIDN